MYKSIYIPVDNSDYSNYAIDLGTSIAEKLNARATGSHVYSAALHDRRFRDMEEDLPEPYLEQKRLEHSRVVHDSLIGDGLRLISDAYLDIFESRCKEKNLSCSRTLLEGKNWYELVKDIRANAHDLVVIGLKGLGTVPGDTIGGVTERVMRNITADMLIVKDSRLIEGRIMVCVDGSKYSTAALNKALQLAKAFNVEVEAVSVFDPHFHVVAFQSLVGVLSKEAGERFKFKEQERLHDEVIDKGLKKIYQSYLDEAAVIAKKSGMEIKTTLLAGKPYDEICKHIQTNPPSLLVISRYGAHQAEELEMGSNAENLIRLAPCNILLTAKGD